MEGYSLSELELPSDSRLMAHGKGEDPLAIPDPDETLDAGDRVVIWLTSGRSLIVLSIAVRESNARLRFEVPGLGHAYVGRSTLVTRTVEVASKPLTALSRPTSTLVTST